MRPFEALLLILNLTAFLAFAVPRFRAVRLARFLPTAALLAAGAQVVLEGARWQMVPAYAFGVSLFLISLLPRSGVEGGGVPWSPRRLGRSLAVGFGALALSFAAFLPLAFPVFSLPHP